MYESCTQASEPVRAALKRALHDLGGVKLRFAEGCFSTDVPAVDSAAAKVLLPGQSLYVLEC